MGLKNMAYIISWLITNYMKGLIVIGIYIIPNLIFGIYENHIGYIILMYVLYLFAALH